MIAPLNGLLLAGGRSTRMQRDKAGIEYAGQTQLERAMGLLEPLVAHSFVSVRADQRDDPQRKVYECIVDTLPECGPIGGIHAALHAHPHAAWLVLACDLPFLDAATLQQLIAAREPGRVATAFRSSHDGKPEPLCAIWEPRSAAAVDAWLAAGQSCPRSLLASSDVALLTLRSRQALDNVNTTQEYAAARARLGGHAPPALAPRQLQVQYFALLREQAGVRCETVTSSARNARELFEELRRARGLKLRPEQLRVAVNEEFAEWERPLAAGDIVVFLPPVAGG